MSLLDRKFTEFCMTCNHSLEPKSAAKMLYLSMKFTKAWSNIICSDKFPEHFLICLNCGSLVGERKGAPAHARTTTHTLFFDLTTCSIYCSNCKKHLKCPKIINDASLVSIPIAPVPICKGGFPNLGNSCYSSAVLAALSACQPIVSAAACSQFPICRVFAAAAIENRNFNRIIHILMPIFDTNKHNDAAEFLLYLLDKLCDDPIIHSLFGGATKTTISCKVCKTKNTADQPFTVLPVPLNDKGWGECHNDPPDPTKPRSIGSQEIWNEDHEASAGASFVSFFMHGSTETISLQKCLESMFSPSIFPCEKCHSESEISVSLTSLPEILILHLGRFTKRWFGQGKLFQFVSFPGENDVDFGHFVPPEVNCGPSVYNIAAVVSHAGIMNAGHYVCYANVGGGWKLFDDDTVKSISAHDALTSQGYILFYVRKRSGRVDEIYNAISTRGLPFDLAVPLRVIADPQKWIGTVPDTDISPDIMRSADEVAGGSVSREETADDLRSRFITRMPLTTSTIPVDQSSLDQLWSFLFEKGPIPQIERKEGSEIKVGSTVGIFSSPQVPTGEGSA